MRCLIHIPCMAFTCFSPFHFEEGKFSSEQLKGAFDKAVKSSKKMGDRFQKHVCNNGYRKGREGNSRCGQWVYRISLFRPRTLCKR